MKTKNNITLASDSYKLNHWNQYPRNCENVYSYFESRKGAKYPKTVFVGLQYIIKEYLSGVVVTQDDIEEGELLATAHLGSPKLFNREGWEYILNEHGGKLPVRIKAVPEGSAVDVDNVLMTVEATDEKCFWLTNYLETMLTHIWYPSNVATIGYYLKQEFLKYLRETSSEETAQATVPFMLHDFGMRGTSSLESAELGGFAHITQFMGTDTVPAIVMARDYYGGDKNFNNIAFSVPATEHSILTAQGESGEARVLDQILDEYPEGILSMVSDSYNIERFVTEYVAERKEKILARKPNAIGMCKFVIRPDSLRYETDTPEDQMVWLTEELWNIFGGSVNDKGYKVLNPKIALLWGDGVGPDGIVRILQHVKDAGFSVEHLIFGMGGGLLQKHNRDTQRSAFKCSAQKQDGKWVDIQKNPLDATKKSKAGRLALIKDAGSYRTVNLPVNRSGVYCDELRTVFENGKLVKEYTLDEIRERVNQ